MCKHRPFSKVISIVKWVSVGIPSSSDFVHPISKSFKVTKKKFGFFNTGEAHVLLEQVLLSFVPLISL